MVTSRPKRRQPFRPNIVRLSAAPEFPLRPPIAALRHIAVVTPLAAKRPPGLVSTAPETLTVAVDTQPTVLVARRRLEPC